jgi:hypothetical protein
MLVSHSHTPPPSPQYQYLCTPRRSHSQSGHACGTFALVHALSATNLAPALAPFYQAVRQTPPDSRTALFASSREIYEGHHAVITAGQTEIRESDWEECDHFISFVYGNVNGETRVIEMDGVPPRSGPLDRGPASGSLLKVCFVCLVALASPHQTKGLGPG